MWSFEANLYLAQAPNPSTNEKSMILPWNRQIIYMCKRDSQDDPLTPHFWSDIL